MICVLMKSRRASFVVFLSVVINGVVFFIFWGGLRLTVKECK